jgi:succinyl-CoA synthetase alpha subunit
MGHAGALVHGEAGTLRSKEKQLTGAGARVFGSVKSLIDALARDYRFDKR